MRRFLPALGVLALGAACSVGNGSGSVSGEIRDLDCELETQAFSLDPTFFSADVVEDRGSREGEERKRLTLRVQRGSFRESDSDGLTIFIADANALAGMLGTPIPISSEDSAPLQMTLYLGETCVSGYPVDPRQKASIIEAQEGTIVFDAIYAPDIDGGATEIAFHFENVVFFDDMFPEDRRATLSGEVEFFYQRGRPAQPFP